MSTLNSATLASDDEEDRDFVPVAPKPKRKRTADSKRTKRDRDGSASASGSSSGSDSDDDDDAEELEEGETKRLKLEQEEAEAQRRKEAAKEAYRSLLEGDEPVRGKVDKVDTVEMVEVKRPRQFAGETIYETVSLRKDDPETVAYLARIAKEGRPASGTIGSDAPAEMASSATDAPPTAQSSTDPTPAATSSPAPTSSNPSTTTLPPKKGPVRRKPRQSLEAMSAALDKGKKMTTLEKVSSAIAVACPYPLSPRNPSPPGRSQYSADGQSAMDWKSHTAADPSMQSELEANRRGGGFLEKQQFLDRVGDRRTGALEGAKGGARR